jgi:DNA-binding transcriptional ArsR family regulator
MSLSDVLYALSDPVRVDIVVNVAETGEQSCNQCGIEMPKSSLSHHFKVLREAGILATRIEGTRHINSIRTADLNARFPGLLNAILKAARTT